MEVLGRDAAREAYRIAIDGPDGRIVGLLPERVIRVGAPLTGGLGHQTAYHWISRHSGRIETTLQALHDGHLPPRAPFDAIVLEEDA